MSEMALCQGEGGAGVADGDGHEFDLLPCRFESSDEWGVLGGLLLMSSITSDVSIESDFD